MTDDANDDDLNSKMTQWEKLIAEKLMEAGVELGAPIQFSNMQGETVVQLAGVIRDHSKVKAAVETEDEFTRMMQAEREAEKEQKKVEQEKSVLTMREELEKLAQEGISLEDDEPESDE